MEAEGIAMTNPPKLPAPVAPVAWIIRDSYGNVIDAHATEPDRDCYTPGCTFHPMADYPPTVPGRVSELPEKKIPDHVVLAACNAYDHAREYNDDDESQWPAMYAALVAAFNLYAKAAPTPDGDARVLDLLRRLDACIEADAEHGLIVNFWAYDAIAEELGIALAAVKGGTP